MRLFATQIRLWPGKQNARQASGKQRKGFACESTCHIIQYVRFPVRHPGVIVHDVMMSLPLKMYCRDMFTSRHARSSSM